ncbi:MAG: NAD-dependent epimerase/dehydratase family protein [Acidobacteriota bacterium]
MSKVLVTGGTGFLGSHLIRLLLEEGEGTGSLRVLSTSPPGELAELSAGGVELVQGSITSPEAVERAVQGVTRIYHLAGRVSRHPDDARALYEVHVEGTRLLCREACRARVERIVMSSTSGTIAVTDDGEEIPDESWPPPLRLISRWPYYTSKLYQEQVARQECRGGPELVILNPSLLLGPGDERLSSTEDVLKFLSREIPAIPPGGISFVDVRDAALAFREAMRRGRGGERYLLGGPNWSFGTFFGRLERLSRVRGPRLRLPAGIYDWVGKAMDALYHQWSLSPPVDRVSMEMGRYFWYLDATKAQRELGFRPRDPFETLYDTVSYLQEHFLGNGAFG